MYKVKQSELNDVIRWCCANIGPRTYYLHNKIGGEGWTIYLEKGYNLKVADPKALTMAILKFGA